MLSAPFRLINLGLFSLIVAFQISSIKCANRTGDIAICNGEKVLAWLTPDDLIFGPNEPRESAHGPCYCRPGSQGPNVLQLTCTENQGFAGVGVVTCSSGHFCPSPNASPRALVTPQAFRFIPIVIALQVALVVCLMTIHHFG